MLVLHVHAGNIYGGVEALLLTQVEQRELCPGLETSFALCFAGRFSEALTAAGATVHSLGEVRLRQPLSVRRARKNLAALLRSVPCDVVVMHSCWSHSIFARTVRAAAVPLVFYMHSPASGKHWLERRSRRTPPDLVLCNSRFTAGSASELFPGVLSETVYCPVALPAPVDRNAIRKEMRAELQTAPEATVIIQVSRMESWKGQARHLEALAKLRDLPDWVCWQVGGAQQPSEHKYLAELKTMAAGFGIADRVRFLGQRSDVNRLLAAADIFCQPNLTPEPFGIVFVEALNAGLPVVTTDMGGAREIVDDSCGVSIPPGDADALSQELHYLILDCTRRARLGANGPRRARSLCDPAARMAQFHSVLASVVSAQPAN